MDRIEELLRRIRDPRACVELLLAAPREDAGRVAQQLAAVLSSLPAAHREMGDQPARTPAVEELVRRLGGVELLLLDLACHVKESDHGIVHHGDRRLDPARFGGLRGLGWMALL